MQTVDKEFKNIKNTLIPYNQDEIETVMKQLLLANGVTDVLYEGSNVSQLSTVVSYVISTLNINTAINLQETILPLATKRMNILFGARQLGYEAHQKKSWKYTLKLKPMYDTSKTTIDPSTGEEVVDTLNTDDRTIYIAQNTRFKSGDKTYYYTGPTKALFTCSNYDIQYFNDPTHGRPQDELIAEIEVIEGSLITPLDDPSLTFSAYDYVNNDGLSVTKQDYIIPYTNVEDTEGLQVFLTYVDENGNLIEDERRYQSPHLLVDQDLEYYKDKFIRKENIILGYPTIFFQFMGLGNPVKSGTIISVNVLQSSGIDGEAMGKWIVDDTVASELFEVYESTLKERGSNEESDQSIKDNAIIYKNTGNRAVTRYDYVAITRAHPLVKYADAWGGEDEEPKRKGHIWVSATPEYQTRYIRYIQALDTYKVIIGNTQDTPDPNVPDIRNFPNWYLKEDEQEEVLSYLDQYKIMTMDLHYRHPVYYDFEFECDVVKYNLGLSKEETHLTIFKTINEYFVNYLEKFGAEFLNSNLQRIIDRTLTYKSGIVYTLKVKGVLHRRMIDRYYKDVESRNVIRFFLELPYENIYSGNEVLYDKVPRIDTSDFGVNSRPLTVDYPSLQYHGANPAKHIADIFYNGNVIGTYTVNKVQNRIEIHIETNNATINDIFGVSGSDDYAHFNLHYPYNTNYVVNMAFAPNAIPRLSSVKFITN